MSSVIDGHKIQAISDKLHRINTLLGRVFCWLALLMVLVTFLVVVLRYGFNMGSIPLQESIIYMNSMLFMLCAGYTLQKDEHVRLDVFYARYDARKKALTNLLGFFLALVPMCLSIYYFSFEYVLNSWIYLETSREPGGIPAVFLLKTLILIMPTVLLIQGTADVLRDILLLTGKAHG